MAKIDTSKIPGYAEMSAEDKLKALEAFEYDDNAAEVERLKGAVSKANSEAAGWKKKHNELLTEDERKKQEDADALANMKKELDELRKDKTISEYKAKLIAQGYNEALALTPLRLWLTVTPLRSLPIRASSSKTTQRKSRLTQ